MVSAYWYSTIPVTRDVIVLPYGFYFAYVILVSIFEVLPKDKKAREEKTQLLGVGSLDLLPFLKGTAFIDRMSSLVMLLLLQESK